jgi:hypothetical protein
VGDGRAGDAVGLVGSSSFFKVLLYFNVRVHSFPFFGN